jgi:hypothetical protein
MNEKIVQLFCFWVKVFLYISTTLERQVTRNTET